MRFPDPDRQKGTGQPTRHRRSRQAEEGGSGHRPSDSYIKKKEYEKLRKYQGLKEELERMWKVKAKVVPVLIGGLGAVTPKLEERLQQIPRTTSELCVQKSAVPGTAKILRRSLKLPGLW